MRQQQEADWDAVRKQVENGDLTRNRICAEHGITPARLARRIKENKWDVDTDASTHDRRIIIDAMLFAVEKQVRHLLEGEMSPTGEREGAVLGRLVTTLDRLIALDMRVAGRKPTPRQSKEMAELRERIAKRLNELEVR